MKGGLLRSRFPAGLRPNLPRWRGVACYLFSYASNTGNVAMSRTANRPKRREAEPLDDQLDDHGLIGF
jgi:hypothetical protein